MRRSSSRLAGIDLTTSPWATRGGRSHRVVASSGLVTLLPATRTRERAPGASKRRRAYLIAKRTFDVIAVLLVLPLALPLLGLCALAVRIDSKGAPFFSQLRTGKGGRRFRMYKLRTMVHNAAELKEQYAHLNECTWPDFKITDDPRVTRVGRFLRRTSLDELPQLINVLRGDMSIVGPRPTSFPAETYSLWHTARLEVKPGLTGLWQVSGRYEVDFDERLRLDISYIRRRSMKLDILIILMTVGAVLGGRGAS